MDYDSSSKFISSLAKFLQSLCNGYVEFDNGVEVIGHIYLSVDTGKKIDYILNEKVCKTDENSVTFISNSFHAQPAEKPKPNSKKGKGSSEQSEDKPADNNVVEIDSDNVNQVEPKSTNVGTIARNPNRNFQSSSPGLGKRPFSPHSKTGPSSKRNRNESHELSFGMSSNGSLSAPNPISDPLRGHHHHSSSSGLPPHSNSSSHSFDPGYNPAMDDSIAGESEERDIKPTVDTDVTFVKEEFQPSSCSQVQDERGQGVDGSFPSMFPSNQSYAEGGGGGPSNPSFGQDSRLSYTGAGERPDMYDDNSMMSTQMEGSEAAADTSGGTAMPSGQERNRPSSGPHDPHWNWNQQRRRAPYNHHPPGRGPSSTTLMQAPSASAYPLSPMARARTGHAVTTCPKCGGIYTNAKTCSFHIPICNGSNRLMCRFCHRVYSQMCALKEHMRGKHGVGDMLSCQYCGRLFKYKPQLYDHNCPNKAVEQETRQNRHSFESSPLPPPSPNVGFNFNNTSDTTEFTEVNINPEVNIIPEVNIKHEV